MQPGQHEGQEIRAEGRHHAETDQATEIFRRVAGDVLDLVERRQHAARQFDNDFAQRCRPRAARRPVDEFRLQPVLEKLELGRQGRLRHIALLCGGTEMAGFADSHQIFQLAMGGPRGHRSFR